MQIQIDLPEDINRAVKIYKEFYKFNTMQEAVINIVFNGLLAEEFGKKILDIERKIQITKEVKKNEK